MLHIFRNAKHQQYDNACEIQLASHLDTSSSTKVACFFYRSVMQSFASLFLFYNETHHSPRIRVPASETHDATARQWDNDVKRDLNKKKKMLYSHMSRIVSVRLGVHPPVEISCIQAKRKQLLHWVDSSRRKCKNIIIEALYKKKLFILR